MTDDPEHFLISGSLLKIYTNDALDPVFRKAMNEYRNSHNGIGKTLAITLTLSPKEVNLLKQSKKNQIKYLYTKCKALNITGVYVTEETKKNVKHLHGIIITTDSNMIDTNNLYKYWKASCKVKIIKDYTNYLKWQDYCCKTLVTPDIEQWLSLM